jgi:membrane carboxypeptidase/penicillin-binding protein
MPDQPDPKSDERRSQGQWHEPEGTGPWRAPDDVPPRGTWRRPASTDDLAAQPATAGGWHLPEGQEQATASAPEPALADEADGDEPAAEGASDTGDSSTPEPAAEEQSPEDMIAAMAANPQEGGEGASEVEQALFEAARDATGMMDATLSEEGASLQAEEETPEAYAARMAAMVAGAPDEQAASESAAEFAARMAALVAADEEGVSLHSLIQSTSEMPVTVVPTTPGPAGPDSGATGVMVDPAAEALAARFRETQRRVAQLRQQYRAGQITREQLSAQLQKAMILDNDNIWWMMGVETETWYQYVDGAWVEAVPPVPVEPAIPSPLTETGTLDPSAVIAGSLPYLPAEDTLEFSGTQATQALDATDPQATLVGSAAFRGTLDDPNMTVASQAVSDYTVASPTVPSASAYQSGYAPRIASPVGRTDVPTYNEGASAPIYEAYAEEEQRSNQQRILLLVGGVVMLLFACAALSGIGTLVFYEAVVGPFRDEIDGLANFQPEFQTARVLDATGNLIAELTSEAGGARTSITLEQMSPFALHAVVSYEDPTFYTNPGFNLLSVADAFLGSLFGGGQSDPRGETITEQIARKLVISDGSATSTTVALVSMAISQTYSKNDILELYMNEVYFGNQSYGIEAAAEFYHRNTAAGLNMAQSALQASIIDSPATNDPVVNRQTAMFGMRSAIDAMIAVRCLPFQHGVWGQTGQPFCIQQGETITWEGGEAVLFTIDSEGNFGGLLALQIAEVETAEYLPRDLQIQHPHFVNFVQGQVEALFGPQAMFQRGFTIHTTLLPSVQDVAEANLKAQVAQLGPAGINTGAVMVTDPVTGAIRALVGSPDFNDTSINGSVDYTRTWQQPANTILPIVYSGAIAGAGSGYLTPASLLWDVPSQYNLTNGQTFQPTNDDGRFLGPLNVRTALQQNRDVTAVKAMEFIGNSAFIDVAQRMGIVFEPNTEIGLPSATGVNNVRLVDLMRAYATIANRGIDTPLYSIDRITETANGQQVAVPLPGAEAPIQALSPQVAFLMQNMLSDDNARTGVFGANSLLTLARLGVPSSNHVAAATGTSDFNRDLWTVGFTNNVVVGVWLGTYDDSQAFGNNTGFSAAAPVWNAVMEAALSGLGVSPFRDPGGVVTLDVCLDTGTRNFQGCARPANEIAIQSQPPPDATSGPTITTVIDTWTGFQANEWCPTHQVPRTFARLADPFAANWINTTSEGAAWAGRVGLRVPVEAVPTQACSQGMQLPTVAIASPLNGQTLQNGVPITGQAAGPGFAQYRLEFASTATPDTWIPIGTPSAQPVPNVGNLGLWDTTSIPNGTYTLRLIVTSTGGGFATTSVTVGINNIQPTATPTPQVIVPLPITQTPLPFDTQPPPDISGPTPLPFDVIVPTATP